ncbi:hypothetical protein [Kitasatospora sp. LaBMicrA B282]|uniref:hypothetical protein n=1 Tax=Kitasatospora sp. LaBMicrA B282 TaxID=3420949 RepID=UPI003D11B32C
MSAPEERAALTSSPALYDSPAPSGSPALYDRARRLLREWPDRLPPTSLYRLPEAPSTADPGVTAPDDGSPPLDRAAAEAAVLAALTPLPPDAATLYRQLDRLGLRRRHRRAIRAAVEALPLPDEAQHAARSLARALVTAGTTVPAVSVGLALLGRVGTTEDALPLQLLGVFEQFADLAVAALERIDRSAAAATWLVVRTGEPELRPLVRALRSREPNAVRAELLAFPATSRFLGSLTARRIAEAARLPDLLDRHPDDPELLARAARLLVRMGSSRDYRTDLTNYREAGRIFFRVVTRAHLLPATLEHHATLLALAFELSSGAGVLIGWRPGAREALLRSLGALLAEPRWTAVVEAVDEDGVCPSSDGPELRRWADWIRRSGRRPFELPAEPGRFRIEVVVGEPVDHEPVQARILIDGRPLVLELFPTGPVNSPEYLLDSGRLRAAPEPREVQLAEAYCTEGCCGALHVTIRREGDEVVWEDWRFSSGASAAAPAALRTLRFDAAAYDAELARATDDRSWSWPARTTAHLIRAGLAEQPELLTRWDARLGWVGSGFLNPETTTLYFWYQPGPATDRLDVLGKALQFCWELPDDHRPPAERATAALHRLAEADPTGYARLVGGNRERAAELGFTWSDEP